MARGVTALKDKPTTRKVKIRDRVFELRELTIGEYDECVRKATEKRTNPMTDREEEFVNQQTLLRFMVEKSASLSLSKQADIEMPVILTINKLVNDMHFPETEGKDKLWSDVDDEDEDEASDKAGEG